MNLQAQRDLSITGDVVGRDKITINLPSPLPPAEAKDRANLLILLRKVKSFWIEGVLEKSLHNAVLLELGKETKPEAVDHPWEMVLELPDQTNQVLPSGTKIIDIFEKMNRAMLILGEPGSGKTITLLELARDLITRAEADPTQPIPIVFNLSSWIDKRQPLYDWLVFELSTKYQIPKKISRAWLKDNRILPLLDGLDEVKPENRAVCVEAINHFGETLGLPGSVVCSRIQEYNALLVRLKFNGAICLQPLTFDQVNNYLYAGGVKLSALRSAFQKDTVLYELAQSPLMLSIMSLAYQDLAVDDLLNNVRATEADRCKHLLNAYVDRTFSRKGKLYRSYSKCQTIDWLSWLARSMKEHSQSVFLIENIQPSWLQSGWQLFIYSFSIVVVFGIIIGLISFTSLSIAKSKDLFGIEEAMAKYKISVWILASMIWLVFIWFFYSFRSKRRDELKTIPKYLAYLQSTSNIATSSVVWLMIWSVIYLHNWGLDFNFRRVAPFLNTGISVALIIELFHIRRSGLIDHIQTVEILGWSWAGAKKGILVGTVVALCYWCISMAVAIPTWQDITDISELLNDRRFHRDSLLTWLMIIIAGALYGGLSSRISKTKALPNQGIRLSFRNAIIAGLIFGIVFGLLAIGASVPFKRPVRIGYGLGFLFFAIATLWYGGLDFLIHCILRLILYLKGNIPRRYAHFLDHTTNLIFLQKVGGGYIFIHRLLLEHFADMPLQSKTQKNMIQ